MAAFTGEDKAVVLDEHGDDGTVRGQPAKIILQRSVGRVGQQGELLESRPRAVVDSDWQVKSGETIAIGNESWTVHDVDWDDGILMGVWLR